MWSVNGASLPPFYSHTADVLINKQQMSFAPVYSTSTRACIGKNSRGKGGKSLSLSHEQCLHSVGLHIYRGGKPSATDRVQALLKAAPAPKPETRNLKLETRNPKPKNRKPKTETRNPKTDTRNPKPEVRHPTPETRHPKRVTGAAPSSASLGGSAEAGHAAATKVDFDVSSTSDQDDATPLRGHAPSIRTGYCPIPKP